MLHNSLQGRRVGDVMVFGLEIMAGAEKGEIRRLREIGIT